MSKIKGLMTLVKDPFNSSLVDSSSSDTFKAIKECLNVALSNIRPDIRVVSIEPCMLAGTSFPSVEDPTVVYYGTLKFLAVVPHYSPFITTLNLERHSPHYQNYETPVSVIWTVPKVNFYNMVGRIEQQFILAAVGPYIPADDATYYHQLEFMGYRLKLEYDDENILIAGLQVQPVSNIIHVVDPSIGLPDANGNREQMSDSDLLARIDYHPPRDLDTRIKKQMKLANFKRLFRDVQPWIPANFYNFLVSLLDDDHRTMMELLLGSTPGYVIGMPPILTMSQTWAQTAEVPLDVQDHQDVIIRMIWKIANLYIGERIVFGTNPKEFFAAVTPTPGFVDKGTLYLTSDGPSSNVIVDIIALSRIFSMPERPLITLLDANVDYLNHSLYYSCEFNCLSIRGSGLNNVYTYNSRTLYENFAANLQIP